VQLRNVIADQIEGKRCKTFCYSGKVVLSIKDYKDKQNAVLKRVKLLKKGNNCWIVDHCQKGEFFLDNNISIIPGIRKKIQEKLQAKGIFTVQALVGLSDNAINVLAAKLESKLTTRLQ
jgi:predicted RecB family nuclease